MDDFLREDNLLNEDDFGMNDELEKDDEDAGKEFPGDKELDELEKEEFYSSDDDDGLSSEEF